MINLLSVYSDWALLLTRLAFGLIFLAHGWPKIKNIKGTAGWLDSSGFRPGIFWAPVLAVTEVFGALAILSGFGIQIAGALMAVDMFVAMCWKIKNGQKLKDGFELDLILLAVALYFVTYGGGIYSLDKYLGL